MNPKPQFDDDFPKGIGNPARQALHAVGWTTLAQVAEHTEAQLKQLHGVGPKALKVLRQALSDKGLSFANETNGKELKA